MDAKELKISDFTYHLPESKIAQHPLKERDKSKLLIYKNGQITETVFNKLPSLLNDNDCLIFNDTKVVHARILFQKESGARIEIMCLEPFNPSDAAICFKQTETCQWAALVGNNKKWKEGLLSKTFEINGEHITLIAERVKQHLDSYLIKFTWNGGHTFADVIYYAGLLPLPPYMDREADEDDENRYQTVYAKFEGSVAAPTAGLHFTQQVFEKLTQKKVKTDFVTLHVGAGTFKPVKAEVMLEHQMHEEHVIIEKTLVQNLFDCIENKNRIIVVGTTSLRTIESLYWFGIKLFHNKSVWQNINKMEVSQWEPYETEFKPISNAQVLKTVLDWMEFKKVNQIHGTTQIMIAPPYEIKLASAIITNFHQPESTLLLLVSAFIGEDWSDVYYYALNNNFRFLSYGDSSILFR
jgi:S-adenosylmethionine:tRNA ribosyltransferase-isomerase